MDFITEKFEKRIRLSTPGSTERRSHLQARIEYLYYFMLGYLWNKHRDALTIEELSRFVNTLEGRLTIGRIIGSIKQFDKDRELISSNHVEEILVKYKDYRDSYIGHGYTFGDRAEADEAILTNFFTDLTAKIPLLNRKMDIVVVSNVTGSNIQNAVCSGMVYKYDEKGEPEPWNCPAGLLDLPSEFPHVYYRIGDNDYIRVSPFILVEGIDVKVFVFNAIEQKLTGKTIYTQLFVSDKQTYTIPEFINTSITSEYSRKSANSTLMNHFSENYHRYIEVGLTKTMRNFACDDSAYVSAVLWGNGGVGKTACAQKVCQDLFNDSRQSFEYIVFVTAKDRKFNEITGQIENLDNNQNYYGIINAIYSTKYGKTLECPEGSPEFVAVVDSIKQMKGYPNKKLRALLLVIDDFETFPDSEKTKISEFVGDLDVMAHKVIITTRNSQLAHGKRIPANELDQNNTIDFLREKIKDSYPRSKEAFERLVSSADVRRKIHEATGGVPIFILQWLHLFVQNPSGDGLYSQLGTREAAREFLSGRVYQSLRENAKKLYAVLSVISATDQTFQIDRLRYVCENSMSSDGFDDAIQELEQLCIIEPYQIDAQNKSMSLYRVYAKSFLDDMGLKFKGLDDSTRNQIIGRLRSAGGSAAKHSVFDSLLIEARQSRGMNNENLTVSKYRHIIKLSECPYALRRQALIELLGYYFSYQDNLDKMIETQKAYAQDFPRDPVVLYKYIYYLWGGAEAEYRAVAFKELKAYFDEDMSVNATNVQFFALGAAYYTIYVLSSGSQVDVGQAERSYQICNSLFSFITNVKESVDVKAITDYRHEIKMALVQEVRLTANLSIHNDAYVSKCEAIAEYFLSSFADSKLECSSVKKQLASVQKLAEPEEHSSNPIKPTNQIPDGCVAFLPQYIKYNLDGLPQYLNGFVNDTRAGIAWYDIEKFGWELSNYGGMFELMGRLLDKGIPIPAMITAVSDRGMYTLSLFNTGLALCDIVNWGDEEDTRENIQQEVISSKEKEQGATTGTIQTTNESGDSVCNESLVQFTYTGSLWRHGKYQGVFGYVGSEENKALLHISQMDSNSFISDKDMEKFIEVCQQIKTITVKIQGKTDKGLQVSLIDVIPSFRELLNS